MGWEYAVTLPAGEYVQALPALAEALREADPGADIVLDTAGITVLGKAEVWPELLEITIAVAHNIGYILPDGKRYFYILFHVGGEVARRYLDAVQRCLEAEGYGFVVADL